MSLLIPAMAGLGLLQGMEKKQQEENRYKLLAQLTALGKYYHGETPGLPEHASPLQDALAGGLSGAAYGQKAALADALTRNLASEGNAYNAYAQVSKKNAGLAPDVRGLEGDPATSDYIQSVLFNRR
jgi:hypothetical protein